MQKTPLSDWHCSHQARMVEFFGWSMPIQYASIVDEHHATRKAVGVFDISHMGRLWFEGAGAAAFLDRLVTRRIANLPAGKIRYGLATNAAGGILDDVLVYHLQEADGRSFRVMVVNGGNREKMVRWIESHLVGATDVVFSDRTLSTAMIAVQGPKAVEAVASLVPPEVTSLSYYAGRPTVIGGHWGIASRTGYTGEDGVEFIVAREAAVDIWDRVLAAGRLLGARPAGLGARDTLRLEAAMPLYGHELGEEVNPFQAGLDFAVQLANHEFVGREALVKVKASPLPTVRIGLELTGKRVPRQHCGVLSGEDVVGEVTSGTYSPTLEKPIAMAYVRADVVAAGRSLAVDIRGRQEPARIVPLPFYKRAPG